MEMEMVLSILSHTQIHLQVFLMYQEEEVINVPGPRCFLPCLEFVEIKEEESFREIDEAREMKLVSYFLDKSTILKKLTLSLRPSRKMNASAILNKFLTIPTLSPSCQVLLLWSCQRWCLWDYLLMPTLCFYFYLFFFSFMVIVACKRQPYGGWCFVKIACLFSQNLLSSVVALYFQLTFLSCICQKCKMPSIMARIQTNIIELSTTLNTTLATMFPNNIHTRPH